MGKRRRHGNDPFSRKAREQGLGARSVFKLREAADKHGFFKGAKRVLDLGAAPGSWTAEAARLVGANGIVVAVDRKEVTVKPPGGKAGTVFTLTMDAAELTADLLRELTDGRAPPFDLVLSDMAPRTTGVPFSDHLKQIGLAEGALEHACNWLVPGGSFFCKVFDGSDAEPFVRACRERFDTVKRVRPKAVRTRSREFFVLASGFRGGEEGDSARAEDPVLRSDPG